MTSKPGLRNPVSRKQKQNKTSKQTTANAMRPPGLAGVMCFRIPSSWGRITAQWVKHPLHAHEDLGSHRKGGCGF